MKYSRVAHINDAHCFTILIKDNVLIDLFKQLEGGTSVSQLKFYFPFKSKERKLQKPTSNTQKI